jgi:excisionase family DNA binding protein
LAEKTLFGEVELYDLPEIARLTGVSVGTLRRYIKEGRLRAHKFGGRYRATKEQVRGFVDGDHDTVPVVPGGSLAGAPAVPLPAGVALPGAFEGERYAQPEPRLPPESDGEAAAAAERSLVRAERAPLEYRPEGAPGGEAGSGPPQLLFMKPGDVDALVSSLAAHTKRIEESAAERDRQISGLVEGLQEENRRLRHTVEEVREETRRAAREMTDEIVAKVLDPRRDEQDRIRFTWLRGRMDEVAGRMDQLLASEPAAETGRPWWRFW